MVQQPDPPAPPLRSTTDVGVGVGVASVASIEVDIDDIDMTDPTDNAAMVNNNNDNNIVHNNRRGTEADADDDDDEDGGDVSSTESVPAYNDASSEEEEIEDPEDQQNGRTSGGRVRGGVRRNSRNLPTFIVLPPVQASPTSGSHTAAAAATTSNDNRIMKERRKQQDLQFRKRYGRPLFERQESQSNLSQRLTASGGAIAIGGGGVAESSTDDDDNDGGDDVEEARIRNQTSNHGTFGVVPPRRQNCKNGINNPYSCSSTIRRPYRRDQLAKEIEDATYYGISSASSTVTSMISGSRRSRGGDDDNNGGKNSNSSNNGSFKQVLRTLQQAGVTVYLIDAKVCVTLNDIIDAVYRGVISHVLQHRTGFSSDLKCCLYRDMDGRLFNLTLAKSYSQSEGSFVGSLQSFSIVQAATLLVVLCRSFACAAFILPASFNIGAGSDDGLNGDENVGEVPTIVNFRPAYLALILGLVFGEEIGQSWIHVAMHVRGFPSISALTLEEGVMSGSDWLRKALVFILAIAGYTTGRYQQTCTLAGLSLACWVLLANLGSRSYQNMQWKPIKPSHCCGFVSRFWTPIYAYLVAVLTGICFPYLGHSQGKTGGTAAVESVCFFDLFCLDASYLLSPQPLLT